MNPYNNKLMENYYRQQQQRVPINNNYFLQNHPMFNNNSNQVKQMQMKQMYQNMERMKQLEEMKRQKKIREINNMDKKKLAEYVIRPEKDNLEKKDIENINSEYSQLERLYKTDNEYKKHMDKYYKKRTNEPYKNILKDENYKKQFKKEEDLIVHKVTNLDKDKKIIEEKFRKLENVIKQHNNELDAFYSASKEAENKKKFEYENVYKFRVKYDPKQHTQNKEEKLEYYKNEQQKLDKKNNKFNETIKKMVDNNLFDKEQLEALGITEQNEQFQVNMDKFTESIKNELGSDNENNPTNENQNNIEQINDQKIKKRRKTMALHPKNRAVGRIRKKN